MTRQFTQYTHEFPYQGNVEYFLAVGELLVGRALADAGIHHWLYALAVVQLPGVPPELELAGVAEDSAQAGVNRRQRREPLEVRTPL
jgi:hypothetical protein